jgi:acetyl-CoA C-acetyltransferase
MTREVVVVSAVRTPFGRFGGALKGHDIYDLSAFSMREVLARVNLPGNVVDEVYWGIGDTSSCKDVYTPVVARQALLKAGLPYETTSCTLDKACVSAMSAIQLGFRAIRHGEADAAIGGGGTTFSQEPFIMRNVRWDGQRMGNLQLEDPLFFLAYKDYSPVSVDAGVTAVAHGITREQQDEWAYRSHQLYGAAFAEHEFRDEIIPLDYTEGKEVKQLKQDEQFRPTISLEKLAALQPIYGSPTVTAGNAPGLNDGSAAVLIMSREKAEELGVEPLATIVSAANAGLAPHLLAEVPAQATFKALKQAGLTLDDMNQIEINEAFAAVPLVSSKILAGDDTARTKQLRERMNLNGGAIAIGHPNTASGARILMTLIYQLRRRGGGYGVAAICGGLAQGDAMVVKVE